MTVADRIPFAAGSLSPLKNANLVGSLTVVVVSESICSMTTCEWPAPKRSSIGVSCGHAESV